MMVQSMGRWQVRRGLKDAGVSVVVPKEVEGHRFCAHFYYQHGETTKLTIISSMVN